MFCADGRAFPDHYIPLGMCRSVEFENIYGCPASRQGCILNRMLEKKICAFSSTERCIPD